MFYEEENKKDKKFHDRLNEKLWERAKEKRIGGAVKYYLRPEVSNKLKQIARAFIEFIGIPNSAIQDIALTGSNVSYNYTPHSDIDLHLIVDFEKVHKDCPIVGEFLLSKKSEFNQKHDIYIYGIPVEVYAEPIGNDNVHNGLYSLKYNKWLEEPKKLRQPNNSSAVEAKYKEYAESAQNVKDKDIAEILIDKIKKMRKAGLSSEGEFSVENLVFKKLRNNGIINKLMNIKKEGIDKALSLEESYEEAINAIEEMLGAMAPSTVAMAPYPTPVAGQVGVYTKESKGRSKPAMYKYPYRKYRTSHQTVVEALEEITNICEEIFRLKSDALKALSKEEAQINKTKKDAGFQPRHESLLEEIANVCEALFSLNETEYHGNYKKRIEGNPEYNIPKANAENNQNYQNKLNAQAIAGNKNSANLQNKEKQKIGKSIKAFHQGEISGKEMGKRMKEHYKNLKKYAPGALYEPTSDKYKNAQGRIDYFKGLASQAKNNK